MKVHTTNYYNTFIEVADDCPVSKAEIPPIKLSAKSIATIQFEMISKHPYKYNSDDVIFQCFVEKNEIPANERKAAEESFFSKGQPCLRASPLTKRYGWGVHSSDTGKIAIYPVESSEYKKLSVEKKLDHKKAMRSKRA